MLNDAVFELASPFCARPSCPLHLMPGDADTRGCGNWARLPCGLILGRQLVEGRLVCDACAKSLPLPS
jgi:hypothetical protein